MTLSHLKHPEVTFMQPSMLWKPSSHLFPVLSASEPSCKSCMSLCVSVSELLLLPSETHSRYNEWETQPDLRTRGGLKLHGLTLLEPTQNSRLIYRLCTVINHQYGTPCDDSLKRLYSHRSHYMVFLVKSFSIESDTTGIVGSLFIVFFHFRNLEVGVG